MNRRVLLIQYTNPGGYPPLHHIAGILRADGFELRFLGTGAYGTDSLGIPGADVRRMKFRKGGLLQKLHYLRFVMWCLLCCLIWRPRLVYASDPFSTPVGVLVHRLLRLQVIYHEHDSPTAWQRDDHQLTSWMRSVNGARLSLMGEALRIVVPSEGRANVLREQVADPSRIVTVWNVPSRNEVRSRRVERPSEFTLWYHGSLTNERVPVTILEAMAGLDVSIRLVVVGYETVGSVGFVHEFQQSANYLGVGDRVTIHPPMQRSQLLDESTRADAGLALILTEREDVNMDAMSGASNKPFDYLACGLAVVVNDSRDWKEMFVDPGFGVASDPASAEDLSKQFEWLARNRTRCEEMGASGRQRVLESWNYEHHFEPVRAIIGSLR